MMQQAFLVHIRENPEGYPGLDHSQLPTNNYGIPIPQSLSDSELNAMKSGITHFMTNTFGVRAFIFCMYPKKQFGQKGLVSWEKNKNTTWEALQRGDYTILAGLCATIFQASPAWKTLAIETGPAGLAARPVINFAVMRDWFAQNHVCRKSAERLVKDNDCEHSNDWVRRSWASTSKFEQISTLRAASVFKEKRYQRVDKR